MTLLTLTSFETQGKDKAVLSREERVRTSTWTVAEHATVKSVIL